MKRKQNGWVNISDQFFNGWNRREKNRFYSTSILVIIVMSICISVELPSLVFNKLFCFNLIIENIMEEIKLNLLLQMVLLLCLQTHHDVPPVQLISTRSSDWDAWQMMDVPNTSSAQPILTQMLLLIDEMLCHQ